MINVNQITSQLARMSDPALQKYAMMNKSDPYTVSLALSESNRRKAMRQGAAPMPGQRPKVVDQDISQMAAVDPMGNFTGAMPENTGIGQIPAPNMQGMGKAEGGIVGYAGGGEIPKYAGPTDGSLIKSYAINEDVVDPATGRTYTPAELNALLKTNPKAVMDMIHKQPFVQNPPVFPKGNAGIQYGVPTDPMQQKFSGSQPGGNILPTTTGYEGRTIGQVLSGIGRRLNIDPLAPQKVGEKTYESGLDIEGPGSSPMNTGRAPTVEELIAAQKNPMGNTVSFAPQDTTSKTSPLAKLPTTSATTAPTSVGQPTKTAPAAGLDSVNSFANQMMGIDKFLPKKEAAPVEETFMKKREEASAPVWAKFESTIDKEKNRLNEGKEQDFYMALIEGGLAAAGGTSPSGLQNLAQGFSKGASSYKEALKDFRKASQENSKMELDMERAKAAEKRGDMDAFQKYDESVKNRNADIDKLKTSGIFALQNVHTSGAYQLESTRQHVAGTIAAHGMPTGTERIIGQMPGKTFEEKLKAYSAVMGPEAKGDSATLIKYMSMNPAQKMQFKKENPQVAAALDAQLLTNTLRPVNVPNALP